MSEEHPSSIAGGLLDALAASQDTLLVPRGGRVAALPAHEVVVDAMHEPGASGRPLRLDGVWGG